MRLALLSLFLAGHIALTTHADETKPVATETQLYGQEVINTRSTTLPKRILVRFTDEPEFDSAALHQELGTKLVRKYSSIKGLEVVEVVSDQDINNIIKKYQANPHVLYAEPDSNVTAQ